MTCSYVPMDTLSFEDFSDMWLKILPFVKKLVPKTHGRITETSLLEEVRKGETQLWVSFDIGNDIIAFIMTKVRVYPKKRLLSFEYIGGEKIDDWFTEAHDVISQWAAIPESQGGPGCQGVEAYGRIGWVRFLKPRGWTQEFCVYERMFQTDG